MDGWRIRLIQAACVLVLLATLRVEIPREQNIGELTVIERKKAA